MTRKELWFKKRIIASLWWCEDEECDCYEPIIEQISPNLKLGFPFIIRERLWSGSFISGPSDGDLYNLEKELYEASKAYNAEIIHTFQYFKKGTA